MGGGLCCAEKIPEISNEGGARAKNGGISGILRTAYRKRLYCKPMVVMESVHSEGVPLGDLNPPDIRNPKWGNSNPKNNQVPEINFIHLSAVGKFAEFSGEIVFQIGPKMVEISPEN